jgi:hypothetical protein
VTALWRRTRRWIPGAVAASLAAAAALRPVDVIEVENAARGKTARIALYDGESFSVTAHHSMYEQPVTEEFVVDENRRIVLKSVSSPSAAVREYFGIVALGERHAVERAMDQVVFRVAAGIPQRFRLGGLERSFLEFGDHGDRLVMRALRGPAAAYWLSTGLGRVTAAVRRTDS